MNYKCKMCGGELEYSAIEGVLVCPYCSSKQTVTTTANESTIRLLNRANALRLNKDFDKAETLYERIILENETEAEAYWGLILCKYGIEYVDDAKTGKRVITCHRTSYDAIKTDDNYKKAIRFASHRQRELYEEEAEIIDEIQKGALAIAKNEKPYDVFICYKQTDEKGNKTKDSVRANELYHKLTGEGFKVFFAGITLKGMLGTAYEPRIFSALNSAKVMLVVGLSPENFNSVWVKNEWSRFLKMMKTDAKKMLIPCYADMDAYDLPEEFAHLQAVNMNDLGFILDIIDVVKKAKIADEKTVNNATIIEYNTGEVSTNASIETLLKRARLFLSEENYTEARRFAEKALDVEPECADAYLIQLLCDYEVTQIDDLKSDGHKPFEDNINYKRLLRFGNSDIKNEIENVRQGYYFNKAQSIVAKKEIGRIEYERAIAFLKQCPQNQAVTDLVKVLDEKRKETEKIGKKRIKKFLLSLLIIVSIAILGAIIAVIAIFAPKAARNYCVLEERISGEYTVVGYEGYSKSVKIPSEHKGKPITSIEDYAFCKCESLTSVTIPNSVTSIGEGAFYNCTGLTSIMIPNSVTSIGEGAFYNCTGLTSITIPSSVTSIGEGAFFGCTSLTSITIGNSVTSIGNHAFEGCSSLTSITIPNSVTSVGVYAFSHCTSLTSITISNSVTSIGEGAFWACPSLTSVTIPNSVTSIGDWAFEDCSSLTSITIPSRVTSIGESAFSGCTSLTSVTIPNSVTSVGKYAFYDCTSLTNVTIPNSVTSVGVYAFSHCTSLTSITISNSVTSIGEGAFWACPSLTSVTIPNSVTSIGEGAFYNCTGLTSIMIPNSVTSIGDDAFSGCPIEKATVPTNAISYIKDSSLKEVIISSGDSIGDWAFYKCTSLTSITIGNSVTSIGNHAFDNCSSLTSVTIPNSVTSIGDWAFYKCTSLTTINYTGTKEQWNAIPKGLWWDDYTGDYTIVYNYTGE